MITWFRSWFSPCLLALIIGSGAALCPSHSKASAPDRIPASILKWAENGSPYVIVVDKSLQRVFVYHRETPDVPHRAYPCSTGENEGPKLQRNDRKTPEGIYFFTREYDQRELDPRYGVRAFALDYPNAVDRIDGKSGYGIWFHGLNKPLKPRDTNGCVAFANEDIEALTPVVRVEDTPVVIVSRLELVTPAELERTRSAILEVIETWRSAWEREDMDTYMSVYHSAFRSSKKDLRQWREHKGRLARQYEKIRVTIRDVRILKSDGLVMASFFQHYRNEQFDDSGRKTLYFRRNSMIWKIIGERFERADVKRSAP